MERQQVVDFIIAEAKRLEEEEHVTDLAKHARYEEMKKVEIHITREVYDYTLGHNIDLVLESSEIPEGLCLHVAMIENATSVGGCDTDLLADVNEFANRLAKEAGNIGKNIAYLMTAKSNNICDLSVEDFFSDAYAMDWEESQEE